MNKWICQTCGKELLSTDVKQKIVRIPWKNNPNRFETHISNYHICENGQYGVVGLLSEFAI